MVERSIPTHKIPVHAIFSLNPILKTVTIVWLYVNKLLRLKWRNFMYTV